ncbi:unnamed protein product [Ranitomeya imitator]|uniref:DDE Tnp4 domain-containing protein n=1 Tax=Ranitomeya imitator TaxID=111125 RepID=A0ABN9MCW4_9NEOB|nr:unnamed protein product [Ranitomeya imitator]
MSLQVHILDAHLDKFKENIQVISVTIVGFSVIKRGDNGRAITVNSERYLSMIQDYFQPALEAMELEDTWFQQDDNPALPPHYHTKLRPHTLPNEAPSPHITTRGCVPTHYHTRLRPHIIPHEAPSPHITTRGSIPTHYHTRLRPPTLPHELPCHWPIICGTAFRVSTGQIYNFGIVRDTCTEIWRRLHQEVMPEPKMADWLNIAQGFQDTCQFPHCIGALDGKHIRRVF